MPQRQLDEMWTFAERQHARETDEAGESWPNGEDGRQGVWVSFAPRVSVAKRACCWATHSRPAQAIVAATTARGVGLSACFSDGCTGYLAVLIAAFHIVTTFARPGKRGRPHQSVCEPHPALLYGQLIKQKKQGKLLTLSTRVVLGAECLTHLGLRIRTALVERLNLILRQTLAPWVRKASSFCKDCKRHGVMDPRWRERTPAMAAGMTDHVWTFRELLTAKFEPLESQSISQ